MTSDLRETIKLKKEDWYESVEKQIIQLEEKVKEKDSEIHKLNDIINSLKKDFKYNLGLIKQRDSELAKYENQLALLQEQLNQKDVFCSKLSVKLDEYGSELSTMNSIKEQLQEELKQSFSMRFAEKEEFQRELESQLNKMRLEHNAIQSNLKMELNHLETSFIEQKESLFSDIHKTLNDKDNELIERTSELNRQISAGDLKCQLLDKELSAIKERRSSDEKTIANLESAVSSLKQESDLAQAEMKSDIAVFEFEKNRLNDIITRQNQNQQKLIDDYTEKHRQFDLKLKEKMITIDKLKESHKNECDNYLSKLQGLTTSLHIAQNELNEKRKAINELEQSLGEENATLKSEINKLNSTISKLDSELMDKDNGHKEKINRLQEQNEKLIQELKTREKSIERLHEELSAALSLNDDRKQEQFQKEFEMQQKSDLFEANRLSHFENMVQRLIQSKEEMQAKNLKLIEMLHEKEKTITTMSQNVSEQNFKAFEYQLHATNQKLQARINDLESQNESLKGAIREMSKDVLQAAEKVSDDLKDHQNDPNICELTVSLNKLQKERLDLLALCRKQQVKISDLEEKVYRYSNIVRDNEVTIANLQQGFSSSRTKETEDNQSLRKRIVELELHIQKLNDYFSGNRNYNQSNEPFHQQVDTARNFRTKASTSKPDKTRLLTDINSFNRSTQICPSCNYHPTNNTIDPHIYKETCEKLKQASNQIHKLATEKQILIDLSNRLRSELRETSKTRQIDTRGMHHPVPSSHNPFSHNNIKTQPIKQDDTFPERLENTAKHLNKAMVDMQKKIEHLEKIHTDLVRTNDNPHYLIGNQSPSKPNNESDSVNTSQAIDRLDDIFNLLDEPASLTTSTSFNPKLDNNLKNFDIGSAGDHGFPLVPPLQVRGQSATFGLRD